MKKFLLVLLFSLLARTASAGVSCTLPFTLTNGTLADATQVMANYNALVTCLSNAASAGANTDITSLGGLTTPVSPTQGGTPVFISATASSGTDNAQIVTGVSPTSFSLNKGYKIIFQAGNTNTGPTTFNVNATGNINVYRQTTDGIQALVGGEIIANAIVEAVYDGTQFQLVSNVSPFPVGTVLDTIAAVADPGFVLMQGQCMLNTTFVALYVKMGSPGAGSCPAGQFRIPDGRGRVVAMIDSGGSGRITVAGGNFDGTVLYNAGGAQNHTLGVTEVPNLNVVADTITSPGSPFSVAAASSTNFRHGTSGTGVATGGAGSATFQVQDTAGTVSVAGTASGTVAGNTSNGGGLSHTILQPTLTLNKQVKY